MPARQNKKQVRRNASQEKDPKRRKAGRPAATDSNSRDPLLDAASQLLNERNGIDISLSELAAHSGRNSALVKYYFGNKEGLMLALLKRDAATALRQVEHLLELPLDPQDKLRLHIAAVIDTFHRLPYLNRLMHAMLDDRASNTDSAKQIAEFFVTPFVRLQEQLLLQGVRAGVFRKIDPMHFYVSTMGACDLLFNVPFTLRAVFGVSTITDTIRKQYIEHVTSLILGGILAGPDRARAASKSKTPSAT
jgi:AcrR family transcriptional regulator